MSNTDTDSAKAFDPTESTRTLTSDLYTEAKMTLREHQDTDKHYIGDSLPVPSLSHTRPITGANAVGASPFPARADHTHELRSSYGIFSSSNKTVAPGSIFMNTLTWAGWGSNMLASNQILAFPEPGMYFIETSWYITRVTAGNFTNEMNIIYYYSNGTFGRTVLRQSNFDLPTNMVVTVFDIVGSTNAPAATENVQFNIQHNDSSNWTVGIQNIVVVKMCGVYSN